MAVGLDSGIDAARGGDVGVHELYSPVRLPQGLQLGLQSKITVLSKILTGSVSVN